MDIRDQVWVNKEESQVLQATAGHVEVARLFPRATMQNKMFSPFCQNPFTDSHAQFKPLDWESERRRRKDAREEQDKTGRGSQAWTSGKPSWREQIQLATSRGEEDYWDGDIGRTSMLYGSESVVRGPSCKIRLEAANIVGMHHM